MALTVAVEGLPGCGKTTVIQMMMKELGGAGFKVERIDIEANGHAPILREITENYPFGHPSRTLIFWVLRLEQYDAIQEAKERADIIIADRYLGSAWAMDVYGHGLPKEFLGWATKHIKEEPDVTLFFKAPQEIIRKRKVGKTMRDRDFADRVEKGYEELSRLLSWTTIDATKEPEAVKEDCMKIILPRLQESKTKLTVFS